MIKGVLEEVLDEIKQHDKDHPNHGIACICMDELTRKIRLVIKDSNLSLKGLSNLGQIFSYLTNDGL